jgi:hypothetical protein
LLSWHARRWHAVPRGELPRSDHGGDPNTFTSAANPNANINIPGAQEGNPNLRAETARTWTAGVVLRPGFVPRRVALFPLQGVHFRFKELWQHDVQHHQLDATEDFALYAGVNNLAGQRPDIGFETNVPISPLGRYIYAGAKMRI